MNARHLYIFVQKIIRASVFYCFPSNFLALCVFVFYGNDNTCQEIRIQTAFNAEIYVVLGGRELCSFLCYLTRLNCKCWTHLGYCSDFIAWNIDDGFNLFYAELQI